MLPNSLEHNRYNPNHLRLNRCYSSTKTCFKIKTWPNEDGILLKSRAFIKKKWAFMNKKLTFIKKKWAFGKKWNMGVFLIWMSFY